MTLNLSTAPAISQRTNVYAAREMLKRAQPVIVLSKMGKSVQMPTNKGVNARFRRSKPVPAALTPLQEGVTPQGVPFEFEDVPVQLKQYGQVMYITDVIQDTHEDPVLNEMTEVMGESIGRTVEALNYGVVRAGTNVFYANGSARNQVNTPISIAKQRAVTRALKAQKGMKLTTILDGSANYNTTPIEAAYIAVGHTDLESDIRGLAGFTPVAEYGQRRPISEYEVGSVEDVRYVLSPDLEPFLGAGGSAGTTMVPATGQADVYPVLFFAKEAWGTVALRGREALSPTIIPAGTKTKDDPLGQRGVVAWKTWHAAVILNQAWMARLEVAVTAL
jgi:N4-gp56 family major capsid protein